MRIGETMGKRESLDVLQKLMTKGIWKTEAELMEKVLHCFPSSFDGLTEKDAYIVADYGLTVASQHDVLQNDRGICIDIWEDLDKPKKFSPKFGMREVNTPMKGLKTRKRSADWYSMDRYSIEETTKTIENVESLGYYSFSTPTVAYEEAQKEVKAFPPNRD